MTRKVLFVQSQTEMGGAETSLLTLLQAADRSRLAPAVALLGFGHGNLSEVLRGAGIEVFDLAAGRLRYVWAWAATSLRLARLARRGSFQAVVANGYHPHLYSHPAARLAGARSLVFCHDIPRPAGQMILIDRLSFAMGADGYLAPGLTVAAAVRERIGGRRPVFAVPNGVCPKRYRPDAAAAARLRAELGLAPEHVVVTVAGRLHPGKGQHVFLEAAAKFAAEIPEARFLVVGAALFGMEDDYPERLRVLAAGLGIADRVVFAGPRSDMPAVYGASDVVALPSVAPEAFPMVVIEAMASARPVVVARTGGAAEAVAGGVGGLSFEPGDAGELAGHLRRLCRDAGLRRQMGEAGRARAVSAYSDKASAAALAAAVEQLTAAPKKAAAATAVAATAPTRPVVVTGAWPPQVGGVADHSRLLALEFARRGLPVEVATTDGAIRRFEDLAGAAPARNVLFVQSQTEIGGAEVVLLNTLRVMDRARIRPAVAVLGFGRGELSARLREAGVEVFDLAAGRLRYLFSWARTVRRLARLARERRFEVLVANGYHPHLYSHPAARLAGARSVVFTHEYPHVLRPATLIERISFALDADAYLAPGCVVAEKVRERIRGRRPVLAVPNGVPLEQFRPEADAGLRAELGLAADATVVTIVGRLQPWKGQHVFLEAAALVAGAEPGARFLVVGAALFGMDSDYPRKLRRQAERLGLSGRVIFAGGRSDMPAVYAASDVVVLASVEPEAFPMVVIEAMASARPVVAARIGGAAEAIEGQTGGLSFEPGNVQELAGHLLRLCREPELRRRMGQAARARVAERYTVEVAARQMAEAIESVAAAPGPAGRWSIRGARRLAEALARAPQPGPRAVFFQYVPHLYGRRGLSAGAALFPLLCRRRGLPVLAHFHEVCVPWSANPLRLALSAAHRLQAAAIIAGSEAASFSNARDARLMRPALAFLGRRWAVLASGPTVPVGELSAEERTAARARWARPGEALVVVFGLATRGKRYDLAVEALALLRAGGRSVRLLMLGDQESGDAAYCAEVRELARRRGVAEWLTWSGRLPPGEVSATLAGADVMWNLEAGGLTTRNATAACAFALGLPVVAFRRPELDGCFRDGENLLLAGEQSPQALAEATARVLSGPELAERLRRGGHRLHDEVFAWPVIAEGSLGLIDRMRA